MSAPTASGGAAAGAGGAAPAGENGGWSGVVNQGLKSVAMFLAIQMAMKYGAQYLGIGPKPSATPPPAAPSAEGTAAGAATTVPPYTPGRLPPLNAEPYWPLGTPLSMLLYTSTSPTAVDLDLAHPLIVWDGLTYGNWKDARSEDLMIDIPASVRAENGSLWMDILLVKNGGSSPLGKAPGEVVGYRKQLTRFLPKRRVRKEKLLVGGSHDDQAIEEVPEVTGPPPIVAHWSANLTLTIVSSGGTQNINGLAPPCKPHYSLAQLSPDAPKAYYPPVFPNDFWLLRENMLPINSTDTKLPLHVTYSAISSMKHNIMAAMTQSFEEQAATQGTGAEMDEVKRMLTETSPWLLITTAIVTVLHTVFEFLAFSSDVSHWRKKDKDLVGVSFRTILTNCFVQLVILLYLQDSSEETSFMILAGQGIGLLIEAWKITKVVDIKVKPAQGLIPYTIVFEDKKVLSEEEKKTQEYDKLAFRLVSYGAMPLLAGYTVYSLLYETHRGWYSFVVTTLAQAIYMFGFVQLIPQLIINYKLKSVAHMPMRAMMYKTLGTVIDDFFAFCVRMPWLHRLACFRDDVVFVILLYQRWIYRIDYSRANEYGQVAQGMVEPVDDEKAAADDKMESKKNK